MIEHRGKTPWKRKCLACIYSCTIKWRLQKTFINKRLTSKEINSRSARRAIYPQMNRVPALIRFMVDWTMVLLDFMELWVWKLTTDYSHLEVLWQFCCRLWKRGVQWLDKHLWHFLSAVFKVTYPFVHLFCYFQCFLWGTITLSTIIFYYFVLNSLDRYTTFWFWH